MDGVVTHHHPGRVALRSDPLSRISPEPQLFAPLRPSSLALSTTVSPVMPPSQFPSHRLDILKREQALLAQLKFNVPVIWEMVETEIQNLRASQGSSPHGSDLSGASTVPGNPLRVAFTAGLGSHSPVRCSTRMRVKLPIPAEKYPDYNFVGRLLGPRGTTLKKLERDTGCKIMIRGRGSIRKDKEIEVLGKPGWEHVFNEALHVVIEASDAVEGRDSTQILARAREMVKLLLVPMPEDRDTLKRQQLRILALLNGTYRASDNYQCSSAQSHRTQDAVTGRRAPTHLIPFPASVLRF